LGVFIGRYCLVNPSGIRHSSMPYYIVDNGRNEYVILFSTYVLQPSTSGADG
jgi:hypothetical protein